MATTLKRWCAMAIRALALVVIVPGALVVAAGGVLWMAADRVEGRKRDRSWMRRPMGG